MDDMTKFLYNYVMNNNPYLIEDEIEEVRALNSHDLLVKFKNGRQDIFDTFANTSRRIDHDQPLSDEHRRLVFKRRLQSMMNRKWVTQDELAKRIGTSQQMISRYLTGQSIPSAITLKKIAEALDCHTDDFYE